MCLSSDDVQIDEDLIHKEIEKVFECENLPDVSIVHSSHISESKSFVSLQFSNLSITPVGSSQNHEEPKKVDSES